MKAKLLQFCENSRPAYYGTWQKTSKAISGRRPFGRDIIFDYEYDSDEDWEDVENGESLSDSENDAEEGGDEELNQYEVDNEFFVPHGYLSDGEGDNDDDEGDTVKDDNANENFVSVFNFVFVLISKCEFIFRLGFFSSEKSSNVLAR